ncbi:Uncharacterized protein conserved in bacteria [Cronobacter sakazakii]|nr:Uncharacterized protein conserved in bacteria [Cronobacter sakazakii]
MSDAIMEKNGQKAAQLLGQSRYRVDIHGCNDFLDVLSFSAEEALSKPWYYDIALTCENPDIACDTLLLKPGSFTFQTPLFTGAPATGGAQCLWCRAVVPACFDFSRRNALHAAAGAANRPDAPHPAQ